MKKYMKKIATVLAFCMFFTASSTNLSIAEEDTTVLVQDASSEVNELDKITSEIKEIVEEGNKIQEDKIVSEDETTENADTNNVEEATEENSQTDENSNPEVKDVTEEESDTEEQTPAIPEDVKAKILESDRSTLYDTSTGEHPGPTTETQGDANKLTISKIAEKVEDKDDEYKIKLNITGNAQQQQVPTADIVVVIDRSKSMDGSKLENTKTGIKSFITELLGTDINNAPKNIGISLVTFATKAEVLTAEEDADTLELETHPFTNNPGTLSTLVEGITTTTGTNIEAAMNRAKQVLSKSNAEKKYVVFFTDGMPSRSCGSGTSNKVQFGYQNTTSSGNHETEAKNAYSELLGVEDNKDVKFYTVGLFTSNSSGSNNSGPGGQVSESEAINFLLTIQNMTKNEYDEDDEYDNSYDEYEDKYYTNNSEEIVTIFRNIGIEIAGDINELIATDVELYDIVTKYFTIPEGTTPKITDFGKSDLSINKGIESSFTIATTESGEDKISLSINEIKAPGITISFTVKAEDPYFYGKGIPTNTEAKIESFNDPLYPNKTGSGTFPVPTVNIDPKIGSISVTKVVENGDKIVAPTNDIFSILIKRMTTVNNESVVDKQYNMSIQSGEANKQTMSFILIKEDTDLTFTSKHEDTANYAMLTVGNYTVEELVPMNYKQTSTLINGNSTTNFELNKDNEDINIKITNTYVNDSYFFDKIIKSNIFNFLKTS